MFLFADPVVRDLQIPLSPLSFSISVHERNASSNNVLAPAPIAGCVGRFTRGHHATSPADHGADIAGCQISDKARRIEVANMRAWTV